jgi:RNA polymerase sigma-70 factor (ECF subfamily)
MRQKPTQKMNLLRPPASDNTDMDGQLALQRAGAAGSVWVATASDEELVVLCQDSRHVAFEILVERYQNKVYGFVLNNVGDEETARDLAQETFVRAYLKLPGFRRQSLFKTWLFRIARNLCIDHYRRRSRAAAGMPNPDSLPVSGQLDLPQSAPEDGKDDGLSGLMAQELAQRVRAALQRLPEKMRSAVILYDLEGLSCQEVASALRCPLGTVKSRLFNARIRLRDILRSYVESG